MSRNSPEKPGIDFSRELVRAGGNLTITVRDVLSGDFINQFEFLVNENNVGDPQVDKPEGSRDPSKFPSLKPGASHSPVILSGDSALPVVYLPDGKYLVSVLAEGYKMGGQWVTIDGTDITVEVKLHPNPLPLSKIRVHVFNDNNPVNGEDDFPLETGLEGFQNCSCPV